MKKEIRKERELFLKNGKLIESEEKDLKESEEKKEKEDEEDKTIYGEEESKEEKGDDIKTKNKGNVESGSEEEKVEFDKEGEEKREKESEALEESKELSYFQREDATICVAPTAVIVKCMNKILDLIMDAFAQLRIKYRKKHAIPIIAQVNLHFYLLN